MVTWNEPVDVWLDEFVAEQLTVVVPTGKVEPDAGAQFAVSGPSLKSDADAVYVTVAPVGSVVVCVMSDGRFSIGAASFTTTLKLAGVAAFPAGSCALHVTCVVPIANVDPDA